MNYIKAVYQKASNSAELSNYVKQDFSRLEDTQFFIVHDVTDDEDICYNLQSCKVDVQSILDSDIKIVNLKINSKLSKKLKSNTYGIEDTILFTPDDSKISVVQHISFARKTCFKRKDITSVLTEDFLVNYSRAKLLDDIIWSDGVASLEDDKFYIDISRFSYILCTISNLHRFKAAIVKYRLRHEDDRVKVHFT